MKKIKIFAMETTNHCNAKCWFCPHPNPELHNRPKGLVELKTVEQIIKMTSADTISINGLGEPLMHPDIIKIVQMFTDAGIKTLLNSNGKMVTQQMYEDLYNAGLTRLIVASDYFGWTEGKVIELPDFKIEHIVVDSAPKEFQEKKELYDWASRVGEQKNSPTNCSYIEDNWIQVQWDGRIVRCCQDFNTEEPFGTIFDFDADAIAGKGIDACKNCQGFRFEHALVVGDYEGKKEHKKTR